MAGLVFCKGVCTFIYSNTRMRFSFVKKDVGLRVTDSIRKNFECVSLDIVAMFLRIQQLFPNLME